jgi:phosphoribosylaminoimidazolecarboxamide formyltransferase/IMP cyclohydrolase
MEQIKKIESALISVFYKDGIDDIAAALTRRGAKLLSTGGTYDYLASKGFEVEKVEDLTGYPSILGGRVKTLHPKVFGGILARRDNEGDRCQMAQYEIPSIDLVVVDLYPFDEYVAKGASHEDIIEKIDIGGISLIRAAAKNYKDVVIVPCQKLYGKLLECIEAHDGGTTLAEREMFAKWAFATSSNYDTSIFNYLNRDGEVEAFAFNSLEPTTLRYGENPHQAAAYYGGAANAQNAAGVWGGYVMSNNNGNVVIKDTTITAKAGDFAFDVCRYSSYPSVSVTVKGESVINGNVEVYASNKDAKDGFKLML